MTLPIHPALDLPDLPRWLYARAALHVGECDIFGSSDQQACIIRCAHLPVATVVGRPSTILLLQAVDMIGNEALLLVMPKDAPHVRRVLRYWSQATITFYARDHAPPRPLKPDRTVRLYDPWDSANKRGFSPQLKQSLQAARIVAAKREAGKVVAACYTNTVTETWWEVSLATTADEHHCFDHAHACFSALESHLLKHHKRPVWSTLNAGPSVIKLAKAIGFRPVDRVCAFLSPQRKGSSLSFTAKPQ